MSDWWDYLSKKMAPKPAYQRPMPVKRWEPPTPEPKSAGIEVGDFDGSPSMITRIIGKIRGS